MSRPTRNWTGRDPSLRRLRVVSAFWILVLTTFVVVTREGDLATLGALFGMLTVVLASEGSSLWGRRGQEQRDEEDA